MAYNETNLDESVDAAHRKGLTTGVVIGLIGGGIIGGIIGSMLERQPVDPPPVTVRTPVDRTMGTPEPYPPDIAPRERQDQR